MRRSFDAGLHLAWLQTTCLLLSCSSPVARSQADAAAIPLAQPLGGGGGSVLEPAPAPEPPRQQRRVYVCRDAGTPVFTDRPCGPSTAVQEIGFSAPGAGSAASLSPPAPSASTRPRVLPATPADVVTPAEARCAALRERLAAIDDQMRSGYSAREAARLWQRWRDARAKLRAHRC
jgi:hypothetical protein